MTLDTLDEINEWSLIVLLVYAVFKLLFFVFLACGSFYVRRREALEAKAKGAK